MRNNKVIPVRRASNAGSDAAANHIAQENGFKATAETMSNSPINPSHQVDGIDNDDIEQEQAKMRVFFGAIAEKKQRFVGLSFILGILLLGLIAVNAIFGITYDSVTRITAPLVLFDTCQAANMPM